jgi:hypothetical protein
MCIGVGCYWCCTACFMFFYQEKSVVCTKQTIFQCSTVIFTLFWFVQLRQYEGLGTPFERIASEYRAVRDQLREKQWALAQVDLH